MTPNFVLYLLTMAIVTYLVRSPSRCCIRHEVAGMR